MTNDREKVIKGLEVCTSIEDGESCPKECPYYQDVCYGYDQLMRDALALLKEQEAVVRCKDCVYWQDNNEGYPHKDCKWREDETPDPDDFCSGWERKEGR